MHNERLSSTSSGCGCSFKQGVPADLRDEWRGAATSRVETITRHNSRASTLIRNKRHARAPALGARIQAIPYQSWARVLLSAKAPEGRAGLMAAPGAFARPRKWDLHDGMMQVCVVEVSAGVLQQALVEQRECWTGV